jgi:D-alanine-D-alanine ligase
MTIVSGKAPLLVGMTYDLRADYLLQGYGDEETAEFDREETIQAIEEAIREYGARTERIGNGKRLIEALESGKRWDLVFNICEGLKGIGREAQAPAILDLYGIAYVFSDPLILSLTLHKGLTKRVIRDAGIPTPDFVVVEDEEDLGFIDLVPPLFVKPVAEGTGKGIDGSSKIEELGDLTGVCKRLLTKYRQPVIVEEYLPGREFTVGITGTGRESEVIGVMEILLHQGDGETFYSYRNKKDYKEVADYRLAEDGAARACEEMALRAWRCLGCRDGGRIDMKMDRRGKINFLEVNPLAGLDPVHSDLPILCGLKGIPYQSLIDRIMASALKRLT